MGAGSGHCLGIHIGHDRGAALVSDGRLIACVAEERLDRRKHSNSPELPLRSIRAVLEMGGVRPEALAAVGVSYTTVVIDRIISQIAAKFTTHWAVLGRTWSGCRTMNATLYRPISPRASRTQ